MGSQEASKESPAVCATRSFRPSRSSRGRENAVPVRGVEVQQGEVLDADALGPAGGAGGEDDVRQILLPGRALQRGPVLAFQAGHHQRGIEHGDRDIRGDLGMPGVPAGKRGRRQQADRGSVFEHALDPARRIVRVQRQVRGPGFQDRQDRDGQQDAAVQPDGNGQPGTRPVAAEEPGQLIRAGFQLTEGEFAVGRDDGGPGTVLPGAELEFLDEGVPGEGRVAGVAGRQQGTFLARGGH